MPLQVPNLDDRTFTDLVEEALALLPRYAPEWTNYNPSDPGITLIELLAYFTEMLIYQLNRVTRETKIKFLRLLHKMTPEEEKRLENATTTEINEELKQTVLALRRPQRAVTRGDYEYLAREVTANNPDGPKVIRVRAFSQRNLETADDESRRLDCPGHISLVLILGSERGPEMFPTWLKYIQDQLEPMRLLTTHLHVVEPCYLWVSLGATIRIRPQVSFDEVKNRAIEKLDRYFTPLPGGGPNGEGWPFGRALPLSEVYECLEQVNGVDYVQDVCVLRLTTISEAVGDERTSVGVQVGVRSTVGVNSRLGCEAPTDADRLVRDASGRLILISLKPYELVKITIQGEDLRFWDASNHLPSPQAWEREQ